MRKELNKLYSHFSCISDKPRKNAVEHKNSTAFFILRISARGGKKVRKQYKKLTYSDRKKIEIMLKAGATPKELARETGVHIATIYRELERGKAEAEGAYSAELAQQTL